jgi:hypothetical protein
LIINRLLRDAVRRVRALVIVIACVVGAVLGLGTFALAQVASGCGGSSGPGLIGASSRAETETTPRPALFQPRHVGCEERLGAAVAPDAAVPGGSARTVPASTATRHIPAPGEQVGRRGVNLATDRAMALLIGWGTLVLICGGLCCGRRRPGAEAEADTEPGAEGRAPAVRVRVPRPRSGPPRHLLTAPSRGERPGLTRAIACVIASPWRDSAAGASDRTAGGRTGAAACGSVAASTAVAGGSVAADTAVADGAARVGDTVVMRRIVLGGSAAPAGINGRRN